MANQRMPIESATITVSGDGASGQPVQVYDADGFIAGTESALVMPPKGSFVLDIAAQYVFPFESQTLGGGCPEWITLEDVTDGGKEARIRVKGTAPEGVTGGVAFAINGEYDGITYTFPMDDAPMALAIRDIETRVEGIIYPDGGPVGGGFLNLRRLIMRADTLNYQQGGFEIQRNIEPLLVTASVKGGAMAYFDPETGKVLLYTAAGKEATGVLEDVTMTVIGYTR